MDVCESTLEAIGRTPLIRLRHASEQTGCDIYGKAEFLNPGGSVKDRAALFIVKDAEERGLLHPGGVIVEGTAGNTGIGLALVANARGYRSVIVIPETQSQEKKDALRQFGADLREVPAVPYANANNYVKVSGRLAEEIDRRESAGAIWANQFDNVANRRAHYETTGPEIIEQTGGRITHFVAGLGTSGTFMGVGRRLREFNPDIQLISVQPDSPMHGVEGLKHMATAIRPGIYDDTLADEDVRVTTERAYAFTRRLASEEGMLVGVSSGAALAAALDLSERVRKGLIVVVFPDSGTRYLTERFWDAEAR